MFFNKVAILGVGLIGASLALALRNKGLCRSVHGYGRTEENLRRARERGIIDDYSMDADKACDHADLIVLATPVGSFHTIIGEVRGSLKKGAVITDVGSVKGSMVHELESLVREGTYYIGSHPIAGSDKSGIDDARPDLFRQALCVVTPTETTDSLARDRIISLWERLEGRVEVMDPYRHDEIFGAVSHLPHIVAYALVNTVDTFDPGCIGYAGQGFKDTTRIAMSSPEMWRDIVIFNRDNLIRLTGMLRENLDRIATMLENKDAAGIERTFSEARELRKGIE
ncbi:MAG TPA: prephenate dehydrogenase/arogenate dehydrogenase family protein [Thermodesulfovibrionales bacterium]|jgi:prephenate dehydrogenase|nr:prephenate dehydrogenase/arogenate dehydrogenase family protein [Thermodesulfovibrionales bacterium]